MGKTFKRKSMKFKKLKGRKTLKGGAWMCGINGCTQVRSQPRSPNRGRTRPQMPIEMQREIARRANTRRMSSSMRNEIADAVRLRNNIPVATPLPPGNYSERYIRDNSLDLQINPRRISANHPVADVETFRPISVRVIGPPPPLPDIVWTETGSVKRIPKPSKR